MASRSGLHPQHNVGLRSVSAQLRHMSAEGIAKVLENFAEAAEQGIDLAQFAGEFRDIAKQMRENWSTATVSPANRSYVSKSAA